MTLSEIKDILRSQEIRLTKSLGQNFLHDGNQIARIAAAAELARTDQILEIGPGLGPLTQALLPQVERVLAIEKDQRLVNILRQRLGSEPKLILIHDDALDYVKQRRDWRGWKLVSNLPYSVASPILVELAMAEHSPDRMVATLQLEVARRLQAHPDSKDYGLLTLLIQLRFEPVSWFKIPASCFFPAPDVDSACIRLDARSPRLLSPGEEAAFAKVVRLAFSQRRKIAKKLLYQNFPKAAVDAAWTDGGLPDQARAEHLSLEQFVCLTQRLA